jgi:hypothetical protein
LVVISTFFRFLRKIDNISGGIVILSVHRRGFLLDLVKNFQKNLKNSKKQRQLLLICWT